MRTVLLLSAAAAFCLSLPAKSSASTISGLDLNASSAAAGSASALPDKKTRAAAVLPEQPRAELTLAEADAGPLGTSGSLNEIIVTAQKYRQRAFDVPISLAVIDASALQNTQVTNLGDLMSYVPGLTVEDTGIAVRISIRGISDLDGSGALVGSYLDDADVTTDGTVGLDLSTNDLARVEVLRGPQGTLYGEGSEGGTIRYITNKPNLNAFEMNADVTAVFDQYGAPGERIQAVVNTPVVHDELGVRIAASLDHDGGWIDQPAANLKNVNSRDVADVRAEGRWRPAPELTADVMEVIHRSTIGPVTGEDSNGNYTQAFSLTTTPSQVTNYNVSNVTLTWQPGGVDLLNSTTYISLYNVVKNMGLIGQFAAPPPAPLFEAYYPVNASNAAYQLFSDEVRLSSSGAGPMRWTVGAFYRRYNSTGLPFPAYFGFDGPGGPPLPAPVPFPSSFLRSKSWSGFGDASYLLFDRLTVGAGVRYFRDSETALATFDTQEQAETFSSVDPRFYLRYGLSKDVNIYASVAKGFRSGGFNAAGQPEYSPEDVWTYELGTKMRLFEHSLALNWDIFLSNYRNYQSVGLQPPPNPYLLTTTQNAGTARIKGVEADLMWSPVTSWRFGLSGDYIDARFVTITAQQAEFDVGDPLNLVARYQATGSVEKDFSWLDRAGSARLDYSQRASTPYRNRSLGDWFYSQSDYIHLLNFNCSLQWSENLRLGVFAQNLLNDRGYIGALVIEADAPREAPRTFGVNFDARFQ